MPRMTTTERTAIATPAAGLQVFDTDTSSTWLYDGTEWIQGVTSATDNTNDSWVDNAGNTFLSLGKVSVGTSTLSNANSKFEIHTQGTEYFPLLVKNLDHASTDPDYIQALEFKGSDDISVWSIGDLWTGDRTVGFVNRQLGGDLINRVKDVLNINHYMILNSNGNVLINDTGTANAGSKLDVGGYIKLGSADVTADTTPVAGLVRYNSGLQFHDGTTWNTVGTSAMGSKFTNDATNTRVALTNLSDGTTARTAGTEFVVTDAGKVGVGTTAPTEMLQVATNFKVTGDGQVSWGSGANNGSLTWDTGKAIIAAKASNDLVFRNGSFVNLVIMKDNGSVGIGVDSPISKFQVAGGDVYIGSSALTTNAKLDVDGYIKLGSTDVTADTAPVAGTIRWNVTTSKFQGYDGTTWVDFH